MNQKSFQHLLALVVAALPVAYTAFIFDQLPAEIPLHYGLDGQPDRFGAKSELWMPILLVSGTGALAYLILTNLKKIDPKKNADKMPETLQKIGLGVVFFTSALGIYIAHASLSGGAPSKIMVVLMGIFFAFLGNLMYSMKPNYFVGIRLPWTLENESNWRKTHQLGAKVWVAGGLLLAVAGLLLPDRLAISFLLLATLLLVLIPGIYSYLLYRKMRA